MSPGTEVKLVHPDLVAVFDTAVVEDGQLAFSEQLEPGTELRLLFLAPDAEDQTSASDAPPGRISSRGSDILVQFEGFEVPISFRRWLGEERDVELLLPQPEEDSTDTDAQDQQRSEDEAGGEDER